MIKNIWIINQYAGSPTYGMNYRSYYLAKEFIKSGHSVTIFTASYTHQRTNLPKTNKIFTFENIEGIRFIWVKVPKYKKSTSIGRFFNMILFMLLLFFYKDKKKPDIIIASSLSIFSTINAYYWSKIYNTDFIFEVRDLWPQTFIEFTGASKFHPLVLLMGLFEKLGYKKAKYTVSLLPNAKEYMISKGLDSCKFRYIPNGIDLEEVENHKEIDESLKNKIPKNKFIVGYIGTIGLANALEYFIEAAKELSKYNDIHFLIVGNGNKKEELIYYCKKNKLNNITFIDSIPKDQVQSILKYFDVCYIGLKKENLFKYGVSPNKLFDYMYSAKPIIFSIETTNKIVEIANCGISIKSQDTNEIKQAILSLKSKPEKELRVMGENGKKYVISNHSYSKLAKEFLKLL